MSAPSTSTRQADLRLAFDRATEVYANLVTNPKSSPEDQLFVDLALTTIEAIDCFNAKKSLPVHTLLRIARYAYFDAQAPLLKLGYALTILLSELLAERVSLSPENAFPSQQHVPNSVQRNPAGPRYDREMSIAIPQEPTPRNVFQASTTVPLLATQPAATFCYLDLTEDKIEDTSAHASTSSSAVKTDDLFEPIDVKDDGVKIEFGGTLDEDDSDLSEPIVDIFCPTTGESRPLDSNFGLEQMEEHVIDDEDEAGPSNAKRSRPPPKPKSWQYCYLCGKTPINFSRTPPFKNPEERTIFLDRIILTSRSDEDRVNNLRSSPTVARICMEHFALPLQAAAYARKGKTDADSLMGHLLKRSSCDLCEDPEYPLRAMTDRATARVVFDALKNLNRRQEAKIDDLFKDWKQATVCQKHF